MSSIGLVIKSKLNKSKRHKHIAQLEQDLDIIPTDGTLESCQCQDNKHYVVVFPKGVYAIENAQTAEDQECLENIQKVNIAFCLVLCACAVFVVLAGLLCVMLCWL